MTNYAAEAEKAVKKFDPNARNIQKDVTSTVESAQSYLKDVKGNASQVADEAAKFVKDKGQKNIHKVKSFVKENPAKGAMYAVGIGAALAYLFMPRNK